MKQLRKSSTDKVFSGVCGGLGEFFGISPTFFRVLFFLTGALIFYILLDIFMPKYY